MAEENSLDLIGVGKLAKAIPAKSWSQIVDTACLTFREVFAPITSTTSGLGRLIDAKFDRLVDAEKVLVAKAMANAAKKAGGKKRTHNRLPKASILIGSIERTAIETDGVLRELWSNLIAQELIDGSVHPEFLSILSRLSAADAHVLAKIAENEKDPNFKTKKIAARFKVSLVGIVISGADIFREETTFSTEHLSNLGLIGSENGIWSLTLTGKAFISAVSDPTLA